MIQPDEREVVDRAEDFCAEDIELNSGVHRQDQADFEESTKSIDRISIDPGQADTASVDEPFAALEKDPNLSAISTLDISLDSVEISNCSLEIITDSSEQVNETAIHTSSQQQEWISLCSSDGYWYWYNTMTGASQWADVAEDLKVDSIKHTLHLYVLNGTPEEIQELVSCVLDSTLSVGGS